MELNRDQQEQLEYALLELEHLTQWARVNLRMSQAEVVCGHSDLATGWIRRVLERVPLAKLPKRRRQMSS